MKKQTMRAKQAEMTKNKIYDCGVSLIKKYGFKSVTIEEIAREAGVSVGTYYYYFKSKFELFREIFNRGDDYFIDYASNRLQHKRCPDQIIDFFCEYAEFNISNGLDMVRNLYTPDNKMFITEGRGMQNVLKEIIEAGKKNGEFPCDISSHKAVNILFIIARGMVYEWCLKCGEMDLKQEMTEVISLTLKGFYADNLL